MSVPQRDLASFLMCLARVGCDPTEQLAIINKLVDKYHNALVGALKSKLPAFKEISLSNHQPVNPSQKHTGANAAAWNDNNVLWKIIAEKSKLNLSKIMERELFQRMLDYCFLQLFFDRLGAVVLMPRDMHGPTLMNEFEVVFKYLEARNESNSYL